jgi:hypothetical protein
MDESMTKETVLGYFNGINKGGWELMLADHMVFNIFSNPLPDRLIIGGRF